MTTLILSPLVAATLASAAQPVADRAQTRPAHTVASVSHRSPVVLIRNLRIPPTPTPAPPRASAPPAVRAPVRATPVPAAPAVAPADPNSIVGIIEAAAARWGVSGSWMVSIARCESGLNPRAYNGRGPYIGLFQFLVSTFRNNGGSNIYDPTDQATVTARMLAHGQAHQWSCA